MFLLTVLGNLWNHIRRLFKRKKQDPVKKSSGPQIPEPPPPPPPLPPTPEEVLAGEGYHLRRLIGEGG